MPNIGPVELIIILVIALLILGPGKLPDVGAAIGKSIKEFRKATTDVTDSVNAVTTAPAPAQPAAPAPVAPAPVVAAAVAAAPVAAAPVAAAPAPVAEVPAAPAPAQPVAPAPVAEVPAAPADAPAGQPQA